MIQFSLLTLLKPSEHVLQTQYVIYLILHIISYKVMTQCRHLLNTHGGRNGMDTHPHTRVHAFKEVCIAMHFFIDDCMHVAQSKRN